ncbi:phytanoyl-CoA dioxygenase family protein [Pendulispora brunnea]|uniref:Phytanoyl-CoA dioxygenase family protein n=1 Tax=Pendulispora brunnea TaxID=2905690 RepID=A0ABZ2K168_9BACT
MEVSPDQKTELDERGYLVVPDAIDEDELARLSCAFERAVTQGGTEHAPISETTPGADAWQRFAALPIVHAAARHILGRPFRVSQLHGRNPLPGYGQQGLHTDWPTRSPGSAYVVVTVIGMFDDFTQDNGATRVVPGSHLWTRPLPKSLAQPLAHHPQECIVTGKAGSVLVFNGHLLHSGTQNRSPQRRRAAQMVLLAQEVTR